MDNPAFGVLIFILGFLATVGAAAYVFAVTAEVEREETAPADRRHLRSQRVA